MQDKHRSELLADLCPRREPSACHVFARSDKLHLIWQRHDYAGYRLGDNCLRTPQEICFSHREEKRRDRYEPHATFYETNPFFLSLRFNREEFCDGHKARQKTPSLPIFFADSSDLLEGQVAFGPPREAPFWPSGRSSAGFRRLRGCAELRQKRRNDAVDPDRCQAARVVAALPGG